MTAWRDRGVLAAVGAELLFGAGTPGGEAAAGPRQPLAPGGLALRGLGHRFGADPHISARRASTVSIQ